MFVNPEIIVTYLELTPGMSVADFGCGAGYYSIPLARRVGANGKVYAFDVVKEALEMTRSRTRLERLLNVEVVWSNLELPNGTKLRDQAVDAVVMSNILFQAEDKKALIKEAARILKPQGKIMVIEWSDEPSIGGPALNARIPRQEVKHLMTEQNLELMKEFNPGDQHYGLLFKKL